MYRSEHPKPQMKRENWLNLNGRWNFEIDRSGSGKERGLYKNDVTLNSEIEVPFCPQSKLSGIGDTDFMNSVWYKRTVTLTEKQLEGRVFLHFGAVDYLATVYVNGKKVCEHKGGYVSFKTEITEFATVGENTICVCADDDERNRLIPTGKQSEEYASRGCCYTRTTGIWQTVWLEFTPKNYIKNLKYTTNAEEGLLVISAELCGSGTLTAAASYDGNVCGEAATVSDGGHCVITISLTEKHLWEIGKGGLYDLYFTYGDDAVKSYFGLRSIDYRDFKFYLNGKSVFQRLILDQGFYPDGIYTAPSDAELEADIDRSVAMGFNGARLHEKVFEERFLYHADRKGYIVWGEFPNWGIDHSYPDSVYGILPEWLEEVERDFNHPSIVGWCPFNETWDIKGRKQFDGLLSLVYRATKAIDCTRPCIDTSGNYHVETDIYDVHDYEQNPEIFSERYSELDKFEDKFKNRQNYDGKLPFFVSEYGGIQWTTGDGWGYGNAPKTKEEFLLRLKGLNDAMLDNPKIFGFCYTQLTDVEQEQNGLYTYDRKPKFDTNEIAPLFSRKAKIEE